MLVVEEEGSHSSQSLAVKGNRSDRLMVVADLVRWDTIVDGCLHKLGYDLRKLQLLGLFHLLRPREEASFPYVRWVLELVGPPDYRPWAQN